METEPVIPPVLPTYARAPLAFVEGQGPWLTEAGGERYLDLGAGIAVTALGHAHPALVKALEEQGRKLWHTSNLYQIPNQEALAERLVAATFADTVFVTNSGTEAIECAIKMARKHFDQNGQPERVGSSRSRAPSTAARPAPSPPRDRKRWSRASGRSCLALITCPSVTSRR